MTASNNAGPSNSTNGSSAKAFGGVLAIIAIILGVFAMVEPMGQRIDFQIKRMDILKGDLQRHESLNNHPFGVMIEIVKVQEKFTEVETQIRGLRDINAKMEEGIGLRLNKIEDQLVEIESEITKTISIDAAVWERIKLLERQVYGKARPVVVGEATGASGPEE